MSASSSISVTVRVRPFSIREAAQVTKVEDAPSYFGDGLLASAPIPKITGKGIRRVVKVIDEQMLVFDPPENNPLTRFQKTLLPQGKRVKDMRFGFDRVFDENTTQQDVYESTTKALLDNVLDGFNATVFAYGATGCGKTHTISGNPQQPGIIFLTCAELFERINALSHDREIDLCLSYLEIYNETIRDLLIPGGSTKGLALREDTNQNISVTGLSTHSPKNVEEVMDMIVMGNTNRTMSPTEANATSSRSHAVLQINVIQKPRTAGISENHFAATLSIIDLAGSERASVTKNRGERLLEGANINRSLLALGNCINSLCDPTRKNHVPYRDSKLTRLLKFSLGGNCKTVMIVCVSPSSQHYDETHNTLKYANRAKNIKTKVSRNMINVNRHVSQYVKAIYDLRQEVEELKKRLGDSTKEAMEKLQKQNMAKEASLKEGMRRLKASYEQSKDLRRERIKDLQGLRMIERRISLVGAWMRAFDEVFESRQQDEPPIGLFKMRMEADKVLQELENNKMYVQKRLAGPSWEKVIDTALQTSLRSLQSIEGVTETDVSTLSSEANLLRMAAERDVLHAIAEADIDLSGAVHNLSKAHFNTVSVLSKIIETSIAEEDALEVARKSLFEVQQGASDAVSHIVKPGGELISTDTYQSSSLGSSLGTPKRRKQSLYGTSPLKPPSFGFGETSMTSMASPMKPCPSPKPFKVKTPKKTVKFSKKAKKVRWQDEPEDSFTLDGPKLSYPETSMVNIHVEEYHAPSEREYTAPMEAPKGMVAPPVRPGSNRMKMRLTRDFNSNPADIPIPKSSDSPLQSLDIDQFNHLKSDNGDISSSSDESKWRPAAAAATSKPKSAMRKSYAGAGPLRQTSKRRSPSSSSHVSPENGMFKIGHAKRMPRPEKENGNGFGSMTTVLSPKSMGVKASARRMTVNGTSGPSLTASVRTSSAVFMSQFKERSESRDGVEHKWR